MALILLVLSMIATVVASVVCKHALFMTRQISGDKLLFIDSEKGYIYATAYEKWQIYGNIIFTIMLLLWILFFIDVVSILKKRRGEKKILAEKSM